VGGDGEVNWCGKRRERTRLQQVERAGLLANLRHLLITAHLHVLDVLPQNGGVFESKHLFQCLEAVLA
jgi:hypothetical protein